MAISVLLPSCEKSEKKTRIWIHHRTAEFYKPSTLNVINSDKNESVGVIEVGHIREFLLDEGNYDAYYTGEHCIYRTSIGHFETINYWDCEPFTTHTEFEISDGLCVDRHGMIYDTLVIW